MSYQLISNKRGAPVTFSKIRNRKQVTKSHTYSLMRRGDTWFFVENGSIRQTGFQDEINKVYTAAC